MATNNRTEIFRIPVDAAGDPDIIQLPEGSGSFRKVTASIEGNLHAWTLYAPLISSPSKQFAMSLEYPFTNGPYSALDVLGYVALDSGSGYALLFCER